MLLPADGWLLSSAAPWPRVVSLWLNFHACYLYLFLCWDFAHKLLMCAKTHAESIARDVELDLVELRFLHVLLHNSSYWTATAFDAFCTD